MISAIDASKLASEFAARKLVPSGGYELRRVETRQIAETDWAFGFRVVSPSGATGSMQVVLVDKQAGHVRTLREAIRGGWRGGR